MSVSVLVLQNWARRGGCESLLRVRRVLDACVHALLLNFKEVSTLGVSFATHTNRKNAGSISIRSEGVAINSAVGLLLHHLLTSQGQILDVLTFLGVGSRFEVEVLKSTGILSVVSQHFNVEHWLSHSRQTGEGQVVNSIVVELVELIVLIQCTIREPVDCLSKLENIIPICIRLVAGWCHAERVEVKHVLSF